MLCSPPAPVTGMFKSVGHPDATKGCRARPAESQGPPVKVNDFSQCEEMKHGLSVSADEAPAGTSLNKKQICTG